MTEPLDALGVSLDLPASWRELPVQAGATRSDLEAFVDVWIERDAGVAEWREALLDAVMTVVEEAASRKASAAALRWARSEIGDIETATLFVEVMDRVGADSTAVELDAIVTEVSRPQPTDVGVREVDVVDLPAGDAVRVQVISASTPEVDEDGERHVLHERAQYCLPLPGQPFTVRLDFSTSTLDLFDDLVSEFDAIAERAIRS